MKSCSRIQQLLLKRETDDKRIPTVHLRDRVQALVLRGWTLEQVQAAKPTGDCDPLYGSLIGLGATDNFVEDLYRSFTG